MELLLNFKKFIHQLAIFGQSDTILVAASAGIDSCVLVDLLLKLEFKIALAHCNFQLRGSESNDNENFVKNIAFTHQIPFFCTRFDTKIVAASKKISIQMAARDLRYEWFENILKANHYKYVATGHHKNDSLETALLNFSRGTGIAGLHGIKPISNYIIRPLLCATTNDILQYAKKNNILWQEDSSNISTKYYRNLIRHQVVPQLKLINPNLENTFVETSEKITAVETVFQDYMSHLSNQIIKVNTEVVFEFYFEKLKLLSPYIIFCVIEKYGFNYHQAKDLLQLINQSNTSGKVLYSTDYQLLIDRHTCIITNKENQIFENILIANPIFNLTFLGRSIASEIIKIEDFELKTSNNTIYLDVDKLTFPLTLRPWQNGDKMQPFGMNGTKKISDILIDKKVSKLQKDFTFVLLDSNYEILWLVGFCTTQKKCITSSTKNVLKISICDIEI